MYQPHIDYDYDLEACVLGVLLLEADAYARVRRTLIPDCFYKPEHAKVHAAIAAVHEMGYPVDPLTIARHFYDQGITTIAGSNTAFFLTSLLAPVTKSSHLEAWSAILRELAIRRATIAVTSAGLDRSQDALEMAKVVQDKLRALLSLNSTDDWEDGSKVALKLMTHMDLAAKGKLRGVSTSFRMLDELNGEFSSGQLILIGARPGVGKSAFMGRIAFRAAQAGKKVGIITLEMDSKDVFARMVSFGYDIDFQQLYQNKFYSEAERSAAMSAISSTAAMPIFFSDQAQTTMGDIRAKGESLKRRYNVEILMIDYLQLVVPDPGKQKIREQEVAAISRGSKLLARELGIPVVMLVQLSRQAAQGEPQLQHLRESGSLEQDADIVLMLHRESDSEDPEMKKSATCFVRKWRNGSEMRIQLRFEGDRMKFMSMDEISVFDDPKPNSAALQAAGRHNAGQGFRPGGFQPSGSRMWIDDNLDDVPFR